LNTERERDVGTQSILYELKRWGRQEEKIKMPPFETIFGRRASG
jgi:hypothetical protein